MIGRLGLDPQLKAEDDEVVDFIDEAAAREVTLGLSFRHQLC
jgi:hypothetical protein